MCRTRHDIIIMETMPWAWILSMHLAVFLNMKKELANRNNPDHDGIVIHGL